MTVRALHRSSCSESSKRGQMISSDDRLTVRSEELQGGAQIGTEKMLRAVTLLLGKAPQRARLAVEVMNDRGAQKVHPYGLRTGEKSD